MKVGVPKEVKNHEYRVAITPIGVHELTQHGHDVYVEKGAGVGSQIPDEEYVASGATLLETADDVWGTADMVLKVKEPVAEEYDRMREGQTLFTYLHLAADKTLTVTSSVRTTSPAVRPSRQVGSSEASSGSAPCWDWGSESLDDVVDRPGERLDVGRVDHLVHGVHVARGDRERERGDAQGEQHRLLGEARGAVSIQTVAAAAPATSGRHQRFAGRLGVILLSEASGNSSSWWLESRLMASSRILSSGGASTRLRQSTNSNSGWIACTSLTERVVLPIPPIPRRASDRQRSLTIQFLRVSSSVSRP